MENYESGKGKRNGEQGKNKLNSAYEPNESLIDEVGVAHSFESRNEYFLAYNVLRYILLKCTVTVKRT